MLRGTLDRGLYRFLLHKSSDHPSNSRNLPLSKKNIGGFPAVCSVSLGVSSSTVANVVSSVDLWHKRLGHSAFDIVEKALTSCKIPFNAMKSSILCHPCCLAKAHRLPYSPSDSVVDTPLKLIHSDLWGPSPVVSPTQHTTTAAQSPATNEVQPSPAPLSPINSPNHPPSFTTDTSSPPTSHSSLPTPPVTNAHPMVTRSKHGIFKPKLYHTALPSSLIPKSVAIALTIPVWKQAMLEEFLALLKNNTWTLTLLPPGKNLIGCTWIFRLKKDAAGFIARHKARLVAQGFFQQPGLDFFDTFSPVVKPNTIRIILSLAVSAQWLVHHLDINNAFLHGTLHEEIYMKQPPGFEQGSPALVCKLNKSLYGLKQASSSWFFTMHTALLSLGFSQSKADASLFYCITKTDIIYLLIYVDDILITGNNPSLIRRVISKLSSKFSLKDLGEVRHFLSIEVTETKLGIHLSQTN